MTAYLQRLLDSGALPVGVAPVPQSGSPVADADQRLLGAGPEAFALPPVGAEPGDTPGMAGTAAQSPAPPTRRTSRTVPPLVAPQDPAPPPPPPESPSAPPRPTAQHDATSPATPKGERITSPEPPPPAAPRLAAPRPAPDPPQTAEPDAPPRPVPAVPAVPAPPPAREHNEADTTGGAAPATSFEPRAETALPGTDPADTAEYTRQRAAPPLPESPVPHAHEASEPIPATPVEPLPPEAPSPPPPPAEEVAERQVERIVEREVVRPETRHEVPQDQKTPVSATPRTAAVLSQIGALPDRQRLRRIHGLRWR